MKTPESKLTELTEFIRLCAKLFFEQQQERNARRNAAKLND